MAKRNRATLKNYFSKGKLPSEEHFSDLIDSMINIIDEGFSKSINEGLELYPTGESKKLLTFFRNIEEKSPVWSIEVDAKDVLSFANLEGKKVLSILPEGKIGINQSIPEHELDINGTIAYKGRTGTYKKGFVEADGKWHTIIDNCKGCNAFEVMAGAGKKKSGKYALVYALAICTYFSKSKIFTKQAYFNTMCNKLKLRWKGHQDNFSLQIRTRCSYGENIFVSYSVSKLWHDELMEEQCKI